MFGDRSCDHFCCAKVRILDEPNSGLRCEAVCKCIKVVAKVQGQRISGDLLIYPQCTSWLIPLLIVYATNRGLTA